jgi:hypothetical protein
MTPTSPMQVALNWLRVKVDDIGIDPAQAQRALISVNELIAYFDGNLQSQPEAARGRARKLLETAKQCRGELEPLARNGTFTNGSHGGYGGTQARRLYRRLLKLLAAWTQLTCPEAERVVRALAG